MEQEKYYVRVGVFVAIVIAGLVSAAAWFATQREGEHYITYAIHFSGSVEGLGLGSPVTLKGIRVGQVKEMSFVSYESNNIRVLVDIVDTAPIRRDTVASLRLQGITGASVVSLENTGENPEYLTRAEGAKYLEIPSRQSSLEKVFTSVPDMIEEVQRLILQGEKLLSDENIEKVSSLLTSVDSAAQTLDLALQSVGGSAKSVSKVLGGGNAKSLEAVLAEMNNVMVEGKVTLREIRMLARTLREDPSLLIHGTQHEGKKLP